MDHSTRRAQWSLQGTWQPFLLMSPKILRDISMNRTAAIPVAATKGRCHLPVKFPVADTPTRKAGKNFWGGHVRHIQGFSAVRSDVRRTRWGSTILAPSLFRGLRKRMYHRRYSVRKTKASLFHKHIWMTWANNSKHWKKKEKGKGKGRRRRKRQRRRRKGPVYWWWQIRKEPPVLLILPIWAGHSQEECSWQ